MNIIHFSEINRALAKDAQGYIKECCLEYDEKCRQLAEQIAENADKRPLILLSGPSGSGKTTTALKIEGCLDKLGLETHTVSMDNYFLPKEKIQPDEDGKIDYESPYRIDIPLLQEHMNILADCGEADIPQFDFSDQSRYKGKKLKRNKGELILFEGIHALNPDVTGYEDISSGIYVSVRTRIQLSDGSLMHPELIRLMRRMIRDRSYRGRLPAETMDMFDSVQLGENRYINPYKQRAHYELDTFHGFECSIYKGFLSDDVEQLERTYPNFERFGQIAEAMKDLDLAPSESVPSCSMVREFIGGSEFEY